MSKQNIQIVAHRRATTSDSIENPIPYYLDIEDAPTININYNFEDIKNPEQRKTDFSQTFKLPMSDNNNKFFEHWFNVNIQKMVYSQNDEIVSNVIVNGNTVLTGNLKLNGFYAKGGYYDVAILGSVASLFSVIGNKKLRDAFTTPSTTNVNEFTLDNELHHTFNENTDTASWAGTLQNTSSTTINDSTGGVSKVLYPIQGDKDNLLVYDENNPLYLSNNNPTQITSQIFNYESYRPAIQIRTILEKLFLKAGFTWTSTFLDSVYFRRLFMTTGDYDGNAKLPIVNTATSYNGNAWQLAPPSGSLSSAPSTVTGSFNESLLMDTDFTGGISAYSGPGVENNNIVLFEGENYGFVPPTTGSYQLTFSTYFDTSQTSEINFYLYWLTLNGDYVEGGNVVEQISLNGQTSEFFSVGFNAQLQAGILVFPVILISSVSGTSPATMTFGGTTTIEGAYYKLTCLPQIIDSFAYNSTVAPSLGIDPDLTQSDFLRDIIQRFNLVINPSKEDPNKLLIEPFSDFVGSGEVKVWDNKIDNEKEQYLQPTSNKQKKDILLTDKDSSDVLNKYMKENRTSEHVYGHYSYNNTNIFTTEGTMQNKPVFAPYLVKRPPKSYGTNDYSQDMHNVVLHDKSSYDDSGSLTASKQPHKLFYYNGTPTSLDGGVNLRMFFTAYDSGTQEYYYFEIARTTYPLCTSYELGATGLPNTNTNETKVLHFDYNPRGWIQQTSLWGGYGATIDGSLYKEYYEQYIKELYSEESRILELNLFLDPSDIYSFEFKDLIYLRQTYWRVINIHNYQAGTETSTKVILLKVPNKTGTSCISDDCDDLGYQVTAGQGIFEGSGVYNWETSPGNFSQTTQIGCCDCVGGQFYPYVTGGNVGFCIQEVYNDYTVPNFAEINPNMQMMGLANNDVLGSSNKSLGNYAKGVSLHTDSYADAITNKSLSNTNFITLKSSTGTEQTETWKLDALKTQITKFSLQGIAYNGVTTQVSVNSKLSPIYLNNYTITDVTIRTIAVVVDGAVDYGNVKCIESNASFKIVDQSVTKVPATDTSVYGSISTITITPQIEFTVKSGETRPRLLIGYAITNGDSYTKIKLSSELTLNSIDVVKNIGGLKQGFAVYQNLDGILFENNTDMKWN